MNKWPIAKLGEVIRHRKEFITINDLVSYKRPRVRTHAQGIILRDEIPGALIKTKTQQVCKTGEFLVAEIDAKVGGFGIVPAALNNSIVSSHYFLFVVDETKLERCFLDYFIRTPMFFEQVDAQGSTNYAAIRPAHVLGYEIPLPPLAEQRRIVARIEELDAQIDEAKELRREATGYAELLFSARASAFFNINNTKESTLLETVSTLERGKFNHRPRNEPCFFGGDHPWIQIGEIENSDKYIKTWSQTLNNDGLAISKKFLRGTVLISIAATIGAVGILDFDCCIPDSIVGVTPNQKTSSEFLYYYLRYLRSHLEDIAPQCAQKNINLAILAKLPFPVYSLSEQNRIVTELNALQEEIGRLTDLHALNTIELNALLPAVLDHAFKGNP